MKTTLKAGEIDLADSALALLKERNCEGFDIYNVFLLVFLSLVILRTIY